MKTSILFSIALYILFTGPSNGQTTSSITYDAGSSIEVQAGADICATNIIINGAWSGGGTICSGALPVTLSSFTSTVEKNNVSLYWTTETEINNSGFRIERMNIKDNPWKEIWFVAGHGTTNEPRNYSFEDKKLQTAVYRYRIKQLDYNGNFEYFNLETDVNISAPNVFSISQNYPNPSNPKSKIDYEIPFTGKVTIKVYDLLGRELLMLVNETKDAGYYVTEFDGSNMASGVYFYRITADSPEKTFTKTLKMILVK